MGKRKGAFHKASFGIFALVSIIHLVNHLVGDSEDIVDSASQIALMAALAFVLFTATRNHIGAGQPLPRVVALGLVALFFSWLGDTIPRFLDGDTGFIAMIGGFFAQIFYAIAFWPYRDRSILRRPLLVLPYLVAVAGMVALCWTGAGPLLPAVIAYALVIVVMAILATGLGAIATLGGILFLISDSLIAFRSFADITLPVHGFLAVLTYILGQALLVYGILSVIRERSRLPR